MLSRSANPRKLSKKQVAHFAHHIKNRTFEVTHQGIALDENGKLVDGQHRLTAIVNTGVEVQMLVTRGIPLKAVMVVDRGMKRDSAAVLGCDKRIAIVINLAARIAADYPNQPLESDLQKFKNLLIGDTELLINSYGRSQSRLTSAPVKLGAVLNMDQHPDFVCQQYKAFCSGDFPTQTKPVQWLYKRITGDRIADMPMILAYSLRAFNPSNKDAQSVYVKNVGLHMLEIRKLLRSRAGMDPNK